VLQVNDNGKANKVLYKNQVIRLDGDMFRIYRDSDDAQVSLFNLAVLLLLLYFLHLFFLQCQCKHLILSPEQVKVGHKEWVQANNWPNAQKQAKQRALKMEQKSEVADVAIDFTDIYKLFEEKGQGSHLLEMEFEPVTEGAIKHPSNRTGKQMIYWTWQHKLMEVEVRRYKTHSGKSWDTGVLCRYLQSLKASKNKVAYERAHEI
jgi:hypothetical protein